MSQRYYRFLFAELALDKKAYRLIEVVEDNLDNAHSRIGVTLGIAYIAMQPVRSAKPGVRTRLFRDRAKWEGFLDKFFLTAAVVDQKLTEALHGR